MQNLMHAARPLANDLFSSLLFAALIAMGLDAQTATLAAIGVGIGHVIVWKLLGKPIAPLQWASLALVLTLGTASLFLNDIRFLMAKPSVIYLILAIMMLKRGWMLRYMPAVAQGRGEAVTVAFGYVWAGLMLVTSAANLLVAMTAPALWPTFMAVFPLVSKVLLFAIQYLSIRRVVIRRIRAERAAALAQGA